GSLLALGSVVGGGNAANSYLLSGIPEGSSLNTISDSGALEVDLTSSAIDPTAHVALAFLDPFASGLGFDALHLSLSRAGSVLFDRSYTSPASALADLDDHVFYLGLEAASGSAAVTPLVLSFSFELPPGSDATAFGFDVAMLTAPEPAPVLLALAALALAVVSRRRAAFRPA
ncbi:MAG TPA: MYXO-CTERM sorting domain-containing protein, partial [Myxococcota bacterium]|nr:MYXO-CTERM sorting domain-containing protein [Myxococcota bacterium]